jgi:uncharacterized membrane protein
LTTGKEGWGGVKGRSAAAIFGVVALLVLVIALTGETALAVWLRSTFAGQLLGRMAIWVIILLIVAVLILRVTGVGKGERPARTQPRKHRPLDVLRQRYERGEISSEEYERIRRDLEA